MASVGAIESSIAPVSPASSPPSTPPDPIDEAAPRLKNAWSQIVRGTSTPARSKVEPPPCNLQPEEHTERPHLHHLSTDAHPRVSDSMIKESPPSDTVAVVVKSSPLSSDHICLPHVERKQAICDVSSEMSIRSSDKSFNESAALEGKSAPQSPAKSPKVAWGKLAFNAGSNPEPEPVMGAVAWPALSEARITKAFEPSKTTATQKAPTPKSSPSSGDRHHSQAPPLLNREGGGSYQNHSVGTSERSFNRTMGNGNNLAESIPTDTPSAKQVLRSVDADHLKRSGGRENRVAASSEAHQRGNAASQVSSHENPRSFIWDQGRGNHSFPAYGRGYANTREGNVPAHHQRIGHRNLPQPFVPFLTPNPGFVTPAGYQNVPGSMYYMSAPSSDPMLGATYFVPPAVQGVLIPGPDPITIQSLVLKQIEYYFSVENLCRDIYLRSKMDERGFVPVSVIANFNRVRMITQNPFLIIEALQVSNVVEVQDDKVRKKGDWANWLLPASQQAHGFSSPAGERDPTTKFSQGFKITEGTDRQSNGVGPSNSNITAQVGETSGSQLTSKANIQSVIKEPPQCEVSRCDTGRLGVSSVDEEVESQHFSQNCGIESVHAIE